MCYSHQLWNKIIFLRYEKTCVIEGQDVVGQVLFQIL